MALVFWKSPANFFVVNTNFVKVMHFDTDEDNPKITFYFNDGGEIEVRLKRPLKKEEIKQLLLMFLSTPVVDLNEALNGMVSE